MFVSSQPCGFLSRVWLSTSCYELAPSPGVEASRASICIMFGALSLSYLNPSEMSQEEDGSEVNLPLVSPPQNQVLTLTFSSSWLFVKPRS